MIGGEAMSKREDFEKVCNLSFKTSLCFVAVFLGMFATAYFSAEKENMYIVCSQGSKTIPEKHLHSSEHNAFSDNLDTGADSSRYNADTLFCIVRYMSDKEYKQLQQQRQAMK